MSKLAGQKALEAYPEEKHITYGQIPGGEPFEVDMNIKQRAGFIKGYDQAIRDMLERSNSLQYMSDETGYFYACGYKKASEDLINKAEDFFLNELDVTPYDTSILFEQFHRYISDSI